MRMSHGASRGAEHFVSPVLVRSLDGDSVDGETMQFKASRGSVPQPFRAEYVYSPTPAFTPAIFAAHRLPDRE
jgi:hypothetical protein